MLIAKTKGSDEKYVSACFGICQKTKTLLGLVMVLYRVSVFGSIINSGLIYTLNTYLYLL